MIHMTTSMFSIFYLFMVWRIYGQLESSELPQLVASSYGKIQGQIDYSTKGNEFISFKGIPYAKPPVNELRFQDPQLPLPWSDTLDGSKDPPACAQQDTALFFTIKQSVFKGEEDCLYLNVFVPKLRTSALPVMVFFHGGSYLTGDAAQYKPHELLNEEIILVVVQYRLGVLGFLSTGDEVIEGNYGMKDQEMALLWVNEYIDNFGGDPDRVTIFGQSAGGGSVHFHIMSKTSSNLFTRAILESGNLLCPWARTSNVLDYAMKIGNHFNCFQNGTSEPEEINSQKLLECLRKIDVEELALSVELFNEFSFIPLPFGPRVDGKRLTDDPEILLKRNDHKKLDLIFGITRDEGGFITCIFMNDEEQRESIVQDFPRVGPVSLGLEKEEDGVQLSKKVYEHFVGGIRNDDDALEGLTKMYGDRQFSVCSDWAAMSHSENNKRSRSDHKVYFYELNHRGQGSLSDMFNCSNSENWVTHSDELFYLFPFQNKRNLEDSKMRDILVKLWTNFAKFGNPTPDSSLGFTWETFSRENPNRLNLQPEPEMAPDKRSDVRKFWESLPTRQNMLLFDKNLQE